MGDEYNVLGNFENLNSANILKNIALLPQTNVSSPKLDIPGFDDESDISIEQDVSPKKKTKRDKTSTKPKEPKESVKGAVSATSSTISASSSMFETDASDEQQSIRRRTRSAAKKSADTSLETSTLSTFLAQSKPKNSKKQKKLNKTSAQNESDNASNAPNKTTTSTRGRRKRNAGNSTAVDQTNSTAVNQTTTTTTSETIEIHDDNQPGSSSMSNFLRTGLNEPRDVMRARRNFIAERAARCPTVDVVDLITSPMPRVEGFIDLEPDSSNENKNPTSNTETKKLNASFDLSFEEDNPELSIKINWRFKPEIFKLRKYQKFSHIFEQLAKRENVEVDQILFDLNNQIIKPDDTPASIDYKIYQFIDGRAMTNSEFCGSKALRKKKRNPNLLKLKVQSDKFKKPLNMEMLKTDKFRTLVIKCAEELKIPCENIKLSFDGENLQNEQTPVDVELEGGEVIEIHIKS